VSRVATAQSTYSTQEILGMEAVHHASTIETPTSRPSWLPAQERAYEKQLRTWPGGLKKTDGGGFAQATSAHSPLYYTLAATGYLAASGSSLPSRVTAARMVSCLFGALVALFAFLTVREVLPRRPWAAVAAGLFVSFQPM